MFVRRTGGHDCAYMYTESWSRPPPSLGLRVGGFMNTAVMARRRRVFRIVIEPAEDTPTEWHMATSPDLPGLVTQGRGLDDTVEMIKDALVAYFDGKPPAYALDIRVSVPGVPLCKASA